MKKFLAVFLTLALLIGALPAVFAEALTTQAVTAAEETVEAVETDAPPQAEGVAEGEPEPEEEITEAPAATDAPTEGPASEETPAPAETLEPAASLAPSEAEGETLPPSGALQLPEIVLADGWRYDDEERLIIPYVAEDETFVIEWQDSDDVSFAIETAPLPEDNDDEVLRDLGCTEEHKIELKIADYSDGVYTLYIYVMADDGRSLPFAQQFMLEAQVPATPKTAQELAELLGATLEELAAEFGLTVEELEAMSEEEIGQLYAQLTATNIATASISGLHSYTEEQSARDKILIYDQYGGTAAMLEWQDKKLSGTYMGSGSEERYYNGGCGIYALAHCIQWVTGEKKTETNGGDFLDEFIAVSNTPWVGELESTYSSILSKYNVKKTTLPSTETELYEFFEKGGVVRTDTPSEGGHYQVAVGMASGPNGETWIHMVDSTCNSTIKRLGNYRAYNFSTGSAIEKDTFNTGGEYWVTYDAYVNAFSSTNRAALISTTNAGKIPTTVIYERSNYTTTRTAYLKSGANASSDTLATISKGSTILTDRVVYNSSNNVWLHVTEVNGESKTGFVFGGCKISNGTVSVDSSQTQYVSYAKDMTSVWPQGVSMENVKYGQSYNLTGAIVSYNTIKSIKAEIYNGSTLLMSASADNINSTKYELYRSAIDTSLPFKTLPLSDNLKIKYTVTYYRNRKMGTNTWKLDEISFKNTSGSTVTPTPTPKATATPVPTVAVTGVSLSKTSLSLTVGNSAALTASITPSNAGDKSVSWYTSDSSVATVSGGTVKAVGPGTATITCKSANSKTATCKVTVTQPTTGVSLSRTSLSLTVGDSATLTATVSPSNASNKNVRWTTSNAAVATVSGGTVKAVGSGTATISCVSAYNNSVKASCAVTVKAATVAVTGVTLSKTSLFLTVGDSSALTASVLPANASDRSVSWSTNNAAVATVDSNGTVRAVAAGTATISCRSANGKTATCSLTVSAPVVKACEHNWDSDTGTCTLCGASCPHDSGTYTTAWETDAAYTDNGVNHRADATVTTYSLCNECDMPLSVLSSEQKVYYMSHEYDSDTGCCEACGHARKSESGCSHSNGFIAYGYETNERNYSSVSTTKHSYTYDVVVTYTCADCDYSYERTTEAKQAVDYHVYDEDNVCEYCGYKRPNCSHKNQTAVYVSGVESETAGYDNGDGTHTIYSYCIFYYCTDCGELLDDVYEEVPLVEAHVYNGGNCCYFCGYVRTDSAVATTGIRLNFSKLSLGKGQTVDTLKASVLPSDASDRNVTWESTNTAVATVDAYGNVTCKASSGSAQIVARSGGYSAACTIYARKKGATGISIPQEKTLVTGKTLTLKASVSGKPTVSTVTWESSEPTVATVTSKGVVKGINPGTSVITATASSGYQAQCCVTVKRQMVTKLKLKTTRLTMNHNGVSRLRVTVSPSNAYNKVVSWSSDNTSVARVDSNGLIAGVAPGKATIICKATDGSGIIAKCAVTVKATPVTKVSLKYNGKTAKSLTFDVKNDSGKLFKLEGKSLPDTATYPGVYFKSSNGKVVSVDASTGEFRVVGLGKATITCYASSNSKVKAKCTVNVKKVAVSKVKIYWNGSTAKSISLNYEQSLNQRFTGLTATTLPANATYPGISWKSSNTKVISVEEDTGAFSVVGIGKATITCYAADNRKIKATCAITVGKTAVKKISVTHYGTALASGTTIELAKGTQDSGLAVTFSPANATYRTLTWKSGNTKVVKVDSNGTLSAVGNGTTSVTVASKDNSKAKLTFKVKVSAQATASTYKMYFDMNGGTGAYTSATWYVGEAIGTLPTPTRDYYTFAGWKTSDGASVTSNSYRQYTTNDVTVIAQWTENPWSSDWVTSVPSNARSVAVKTQYRYRDLQYSAWSGWSDWTTTQESTSDLKKEDTATVYGWYWFQCPNCGAHWHVWAGLSVDCSKTWGPGGGCGNNNIQSTDGHVVWNTTPWSSGTQNWQGTGRVCLGSDIYTRMFAWKDGGSARTGYRYATRTSSWGSWSSWSDSSYSASSTRQINTRTLYRYQSK